MGGIARSLFKYSGKIIKDNPDIGSPLNIDTANFLLQIGKGIIKIGKELL